MCMNFCWFLIFLDCVSYQQYLCFKPVLMNIFLQCHKCIKIKYETVNMFEVFLWSVQGLFCLKPTKKVFYHSSWLWLDFSEVGCHPVPVSNVNMPVVRMVYEAFRSSIWNKDPERLCVLGSSRGNKHFFIDTLQWIICIKGCYCQTQHETNVNVQTRHSIGLCFSDILPIWW